MHPILFRLGLSPRLPWGSLQCSSRLSIKGPTSKRKEGREGKENGKEKREGRGGMGRRREEKGKGGGEEM